MLNRRTYVLVLLTGGAPISASCREIPQVRRSQGRVLLPMAPYMPSGFERRQNPAGHARRHHQILDQISPAYPLAGLLDVAQSLD